MSKKKDYHVVPNKFEKSPTVVWTGWFEDLDPNCSKEYQDKLTITLFGANNTVS